MFPLVALPAPPPNMDGFCASPLGLLKLLPKPPNCEGDAPAVALLPPKRPPGLLAAGVLDAAPPKRPLPPVLALLPAVPNRDGAAPPEVLLVAPNSGLLAGVPPVFCPKVPPDMLCGCVVDARCRVIGVLRARCLL